MGELIIKDSRKREYIMHPATRIAMQLMEYVAQSPELHWEGKGNMLDIGAGSGVLSLFAAGLWPSMSIIASDISALAVREAEENAEANGLSQSIQCVQAEGFEHPLIERHAPYHMIVANILAKWHLQYLHDMKAALAPGGHVILSGIQLWQSQEIEQALPYAKLSTVHHIDYDGWIALLLE